MSITQQELDIEFELLEEYLGDYIKRRRPILLSFVTEEYGKTGFIENGHTGNYLTFDTWKKVRQWILDYPVRH